LRSWFLARRFDFLALLLLAGATAVIVIQLWSPGIPNPGDLLTGNPGDFLMGLHRIYELVDAWKNGVFYPRFGPNLNFGYGAPLFQYYPPLASYVGAIFVQFGAGIIASAKLMASMLLLFSAWGTYTYTYSLWHNRIAAMIAASVYLLSPYLLFVIYERGALSEMFTWALLPWLLWVLHRYLISAQVGYGLAVSALIALTMLGHNATAIFIVPIVTLYAIVLNVNARNWRGLRWSVGVFIPLGLGLSAFYWVPAILEMNLTKSADFLFSGRTSIEANVKTLNTLVQNSIAAVYSGPERFRFSAWQLVAGMFAVIGLAYSRRLQSSVLSFWAGILAFVMWIQLDYSLFFWQYTPFVRYIQFPWRLYGLAAFSISVLFGSLFASTKLSTIRISHKSGFVVVGTLVLIAWLSLANLRLELLPNWVSLEEAGVNRIAMWERGLYGHPLFSDYTLRTLQIDNRKLAANRPEDDPARLPPIAAPEKLEVRAENPIRYVLDVGATQPWTLRLHRPYFPGWQVTMDGAPVNVEADGAGGLVSAELPAGEYRVVASFGDSDVRRIANTISIVALAIWLVWLLPWRRWWLGAVLVVVLSLAIGAFITYLQTDGRFARYPLTTQAHFAEGIRLVGLDLPTTTICTEDDLAMRLYWFADRTPRTDYKIFMHVTTLDDAAKVAQIDTMPFDSFNPMTRWEPGELVDFAQTIPLTGVAPGRYRLLLGLYDQQTGQNLRVEDATFILPGDRVQLTEIDVSDCAP
jgi:hypothetical protein